MKKSDNLKLRSAGWLFAIMATSTFLACGPSKTEEEQHVSPIDTTDVLMLNTEWRYNTNYSGVFQDPETGTEYIFLGDPITHLKVRIFDVYGQQLFDIPLDSAYNVVDHIHCLTMLAKDSLVLLDERGEKMVVLDTKGIVARERSLIDARCDTNGDLYELYPTNTGLTLLGRKLYLGPALLGACDGKFFYEQTNSNLLNTQRYYALATGKCKMAELDPAMSSQGVRFGACGMLAHLADTPRETIGMASTSTANGDLYVFSAYSPFLHKVDTTSLEVKQKVLIRYGYGDVGITPPPITEADIASNGSQIRAATKAYILSFTYDQPTSRYLAAVVHEVPEDTPEEDRSWRRKWSLVVLDGAYNQVGEYVLSGKEYSGSILLSLKNGTWVLEKDLSPQGFMNPKVFRRLKLP
jgi:hypothetical protein